MKKQIALLTILGMLTFGFVNNLSAQDSTSVDSATTTEVVMEEKTEAPTAPAKAENNE